MVFIIIFIRNSEGRRQMKLIKYEMIPNLMVSPGILFLFLIDFSPLFTQFSQYLSCLSWGTDGLLPPGSLYEQQLFCNNLNIIWGCGSLRVLYPIRFSQISLNIFPLGFFFIWIRNNSNDEELPYVPYYNEISLFSHHNCSRIAQFCAHKHLCYTSFIYIFY